MADPPDIKRQRDVFLAFAFASADLFIEIDEAGRVVYATGAAKSLTGVDHAALPGQDWLSLFARQDHAALSGMRKRAREGERRGPLPVKMDEILGGGRDAIVTAIRMPGRSSFYLTVGFPSEIMMQMAGIVRQQENMHLLGKDDFLHAATEALSLARTMGEGADMTLLDIPAATQLREKLGEDLWGNFTAAVTDILAASSIDGTAIAEIKDGRYSVIHDKSIDSETLRHQIAVITKETDPAGEGFAVTSRTVSADLESLSEREATKALVYTINEFERKGSNLSIESLNSGFKAYVSANAQKIHQFKTMVEQLSFNLDFQPIVDIDTLTLSHFEILSRFKGEGSTQEWVIFAEDIGMAADFDIAVCERVINYLRYKAANNRMKFALNLSGQSVQNEQFFKTLLAKLDMAAELAQRMIFEITESTTMTELKMVNHFIKTLQERGYKVCLDDFGAGGSSFEYIHQLHVDYVKIDGRYTRKILTSPRDQIMVKNLSQMCRDLGIGVIAEQIETAEQLAKMKELGTTMGQGYYFGRPAAGPQYDPGRLPGADDSGTP